MTTGSQTVNFPFSYTEPLSPGGSNVTTPVGQKRTKVWSGGDSPPRAYSIRVTPVPTLARVRTRRRRDGSEYEVVIPLPPRFVRKRVYTSAYRQPNNLTVRGTVTGRERIVVWPGTPPYVQPNSYQRSYLPNVPSFPSSAWDSNLDLDLVAGLIPEIGQTDFNPAVFLAEFGQTVTMIGDRASKIAKSILLLRKGNFSGAVAAVVGHNPGGRIDRTLSSTILEVQYGWRPLINDMYEGAAFLGTAFSTNPVKRLQVQKSRQVDVGPGAIAGANFSELRVKSKGSLIAYLTKNRPMPSVNLLNPAQVAWELLPWSFVVDWAIPIGTYLEALGARSALTGTFVRSLKTRKYAVGCVASPSGSVQYTKTRQLQTFPMGYYWEESFFDRTVTSSLQVPLPTVKPLRRIASLEHCLNALSLLGSSMSDKPDEGLRRLGRLPKSRAAT